MKYNVMAFLFAAATLVLLPASGLAQGPASLPEAAPGQGPAARAGARRAFRRPRGPAGPIPRLSDGHPDLTGIWNGFGGSGGVAPGMLPWAQKIVEERRAKNGAEDYEARCLPGGPPRAAPYHTAFFATPKLVVMLFEGNTHMYRQFFVDGSQHPQNLTPTFYGDSRAHWDGDTLVVDTIGFFEKSWFDFPGTPHTKDMHVVETFHRVDYGNLEMDVTIEDPGVFTKPWNFHRSTSLETGIEMTEYVCNENNQDPEHIAKGNQLNTEGTASKIELPDGVPPPKARKEPLPPSGTTPRTEDGKVDFSGIWVPTSTALPSDPSYTPEYKKIYDQHKADRKSDPERFCLPDGAVRINPLPYKIVQRKDEVLMLWEANTHSYRRFFLDGRKHDLDLEGETWTGQSIASWDGDTLVVDTIGFNDRTWLDATGRPHSNEMHLVERYQRTDLGHLKVALTIEDAKAFTKPYTFTRTFNLEPNERLHEYVCQAYLLGVMPLPK